MTVEQTALSFGAGPVPTPITITITAGELRQIAKKINPVNRSFAEFVRAGAAGWWDDEPVAVNALAAERIAGLLALAEATR